jgi:hypothetical protein
MTTFTTDDREEAERFPEIIRDKCPCDDCEHFMLCKTEEMACRSFAKFVVDNYYYKDSFRDPCKGTFNKIFNQKDDDLLRQFVRQWKGVDEDTTKGDTGE